MPPAVQFFTQDRDGVFVANVVVKMAAPGYGRTERAAMKKAAELLLEGLDEQIAEAMARPTRR